ncbi:hypothetical protein MMC25_005752 [Agyrium rufum]|nr:hypothetical protein [Agyrium rufum]
MDPIGLSIGIVGLFSTCVEILDKYEKFKAFDHESRQLLSIFEADKKRFLEWACAVGISGGQLEENHSPRLDEPKIADLVKSVLWAICNLLEDSEGIQIRLKKRATKHEKNLSPTYGFPTQASKNEVPLQKLLDRLYNLVPSVSNDRGKLVVNENPGRDFHDNGASLTNFSFSLSVDIQSILKDAQESARRQALKSIEEWLDAPTSDQQLDELVEARLEGTCEWILGHPYFAAWIQPAADHVSKLLWINGGAGQGKSIICSKVVQYFQSHKSHMSAYFFCSAHARAGGHPRDIARSWLSQLARQDNDALNLIRGYLESKELGKRAPQSVIWDILEEVLQKKPRYTLILDGFDEYDRNNDSRALFLSILNSKTRSTKSHILLSSRNEVDIRSAVFPLDNDDRGWNVSGLAVSERNIRTDIDRFSRWTVDQKLSKKDPILRQAIAQQMADKCQGMFLWIKLQQSQLRSSKNGKQLQNIINKMPTGLYSTYERSWKAILARGEEERERAMTILRWTVFAVRPLSVAELTDALLISSIYDETEESIDTNDLPDKIDNEYIDCDIKDICESLIDVERSDENVPLESCKVQLVHFSIREFLLQKLPVPSWLPEPMPLHSADVYHSLDLAGRCIRYINHAIVWQNSIVSTDERKFRPFVDYASMSWPTHLGTGHTSLTVILYIFLREDNFCFQQWRDYFESIKDIAGGNSSVKTSQPSYPLYYAGLFGLLDVLELLTAEKRQNLNRNEGRYGSPLSAACSNGHISVFKRLLDLGADIDAGGGELGSVLNAALWAGQEAMAKILIALGANQSSQDRVGRTAIYIAARSGLQDLAVLLLDKGADLTVANNDGWTPLNSACNNGHVEVVQLLLDKGADLTVASNYGWTPLNSACNNGYVGVVQLLLDKGADLTVVSNDGWTPLNSACNKGHVEVVRLLLNKGADLTVTDNDGWTPLNSACSKGHMGVVQLLLDKGADLTVASNYGSTPLNAACSGGHVGVVRLLLDKGADLTVANNDGWTPLNSACNKGHIEVVRLLLNKGADLTVASNYGWTPLNAACSDGHVEVVQLLLDKGADLTVANNDGWTPLNSACSDGDVGVIRLLLDKGANLTVVSNDGSTPLNSACSGGHVEVVRLLLDKGADLTVADNDGWTPLNSACSDGYVGVVRLLLDKGADLTVASNYGWTPLNAACSDGHVEVVRLLLDKGADLTVANNDGWTPLNSACSDGHVGVVRLLLDKGADLTVANNDGWTPLNCACSKGYMGVVQLLLDKGADLTVASNYGWTPLNSACNNGHVEVVQLLLDKGADLTVADNDGWTPLNSACSDGHVEVVRLLLDKGVDLTVANNDGWTPLKSACDGGHLKVVNLLLSAKGSRSLLNGSSSENDISSIYCSFMAQIPTLLIVLAAAVLVGHFVAEFPSGQWKIHLPIILRRLPLNNGIKHVRHYKA